MEIKALSQRLNPNVITIEFINVDKTVIDFINDMGSIQSESNQCYDWVIGDEVILSKEVILNNNRLKKNGQVICAFTDDEVEYITDKNNDNFDFSEFVDGQIIKLSNQFEECGNLIRGQREEILRMIERLIKLKRDYKEMQTTYYPKG